MCIRWSWALDDFVSPRRKLPRAASYSHRNSNQVLRRVIIVLDRTITKSSYASTWLDQPPSWLGQHGLLLSYALACWCPQVSTITVSLLAILVPRSKPHACPSPISVHWHTTRLYLTFSMSVDHLCAPHPHTNTTKRNVAHTLMLGLVSNSTEAWSSPDNHLITTRYIWAHINLVFLNTISLLLSTKREIF
jgi:hypothetical protein